MQLVRKLLAVGVLSALLGTYTGLPGMTVGKGTALPLSVLITEVMPDPDPPVGLPAYEYIELMNRGTDTLNLAGWTLQVGEKLLPLNSFLLAPGRFVVLSGTAGAMEFSGLGIDVLPVAKWTALRNTGQFLSLIAPGGDIIHFMSYHPSQYEDALKREGGWSLELADASNPCSMESWLPSIDQLGGTPGKPNSVAIDTGSHPPPVPLRAGLKDCQALILVLDSPVIPLSTPGWFDFHIDPLDVAIDSWSYSEGRPWMVEIRLKSEIPEGLICSLDVKGDATGCAGAKLIPATLHFGLPEYPDSGEVVISEIMFDPASDQPEFIEIHNRSDKILAFNDLYIAICDPEGLISRFSKPSAESFLIFPGEYYAITSDEYLLCLDNAMIPRGRVSERMDFPSLSNEGSVICLLGPGQEVIEMVRYDPSWHDPRLNETKGTSLERINLGLPALDLHNWHSASYSSGGSSPAMPNSQLPAGPDPENMFSFDKAVFCPERDGGNDYLLIRISLPEPGWFGNATVWDLSGLLIRQLSLPGALPVSGLIKWDGRDEPGNLVPPSYYVVIINYVSPQGSRGRWKKACVVISN